MEGLCFGGHRSAARGKTRQLIVDLKPGKLVLRPDMIVNMHALRLIQTPDSDLDTVSKHCFVHRECASASGAEPAFGKCRRLVASRRTTKPSEVFNSKVNKGQYWGARMPATHGAVTDNAANRW
jgi:hypothetical protein